MFSLLKFKIAGLHVFRIILYVLSAPFAVMMVIFGVYFIVIGFAWMVLVSAAAISALLIFEASFFMAIVALFNGSLWATIGGMWTWMWEWFANGNIALWPHIAKSFPPYFGYGIVFGIIFLYAGHLKEKAQSIKLSLATK